jgi:hypothetical protein
MLRQRWRSISIFIRCSSSFERLNASIRTVAARWKAPSQTGLELFPSSQLQPGLVRLPVLMQLVRHSVNFQCKRPSLNPQAL